MHHHFLSSFITMAPSSSLTKPLKKTSNSNPNSNPTNSPNCPSSHTNFCNHSPSATLDLLIFILVLFSGAFLIISYFSYIFNSISLLFPYPPSFLLNTLLTYLEEVDVWTHYIFYIVFVIVFVVVVLFFEICCGFGFRSRKCGKNGCKGLRRAMEFDLQLQGEECLRSGCETKAVREINQLPWKGGTENNPDYECLRAELRKMAPPNGRAVLLFRSKCGCPVAKLEGWGAKRGRRHKKSEDLGVPKWIMLYDKSQKFLRTLPLPERTMSRDRMARLHPSFKLLQRRSPLFRSSSIFPFRGTLTINGTADHR